MTLIKALGAVLLSVHYLIVFIYEDYLDLARIEEKLAGKGEKNTRNRAERILKRRKKLLSLVHLIGFVLLAVA